MYTVLPSFAAVAACAPIVLPSRTIEAKEIEVFEGVPDGHTHVVNRSLVTDSRFPSPKGPFIMDGVSETCGSETILSEADVDLQQLSSIHGHSDFGASVQDSFTFRCPEPGKELS